MDYLIPQPDYETKIDWKLAKSDLLYRNELLKEMRRLSEEFNGGRFSAYLKRLLVINQEAELIAKRRSIQPVTTSQTDVVTPEQANVGTAVAVRLDVGTLEQSEVVTADDTEVVTPEQTDVVTGKGISRQLNHDQAEQHLQSVMPIIVEGLDKSQSLRSIAADLNRRGLTTRAGKPFDRVKVHKIIQRKNLK